MLERSKEQEKIQTREKYAIQKQKQMKENSKVKRRKQSGGMKSKPENVTATLLATTPKLETKADNETEAEADVVEAGEEKIHDGAETNDLPTAPIDLQKVLIPFAPDDTVLLVGEGDFSFAVSVLKQKLVKRITPTSLDSEDQVIKKYGDAAKANIEFLRSFVPEEDDDQLAAELDDVSDEENDEEGALKLKDFVHKPVKWSCAPLFSIDGTKLNTLKPIRSVLNRPTEISKTVASETVIRTPAQRARANANARNISNDSKQGHFDSIVFNFPHTGSGIKDQTRNVLQHQQLLIQFLGAAKPLIKPGTGVIAVSMFEGLPYELWNLKGFAKTKHNLVLRRSGKFEWAAFPGYYHRLTAGGGDTTKQANSRNAKFWLLERFEDSHRATAGIPKKREQPQPKKRKKKGHKLNSQTKGISSDDSD